MPARWHNFIDLQTAIELFTPVYQLFLTDNDFWRATNSLQLDETVAIYIGKILGSDYHMAFVKNGHPLVRNYGDDVHVSCERLWDIVLALRLGKHRLPPVVGSREEVRRPGLPAGAERSAGDLTRQHAGVGAGLS